MRPWTLVLFFVFSGIASLAGAAEISVRQSHAIAEEIARRAETQYVFPGKRAAIGSAIRAALAQGRYDVTNPAELAQQITDDLHKASNDKHMWLDFDPNEFRALSQSKPKQPDQSLLAAEARARNQGLEEMRILPGNIRYLKITNFMWTDGVTPRVIDEAARFLHDGDAVVIDLRGNGGGDAEAVERLISYFVPPDRKLMTFMDTGEKTLEIGRSAKVLPQPRMIGKPLAVLIDGGTGSAAEEFAYHVYAFKLGALVGEQTAGAANNNHLIPLKPGFVFSISTGRPIHPVTKANWEGVGVPPSVKVAAGSALEAAQLGLLRQLAVKNAGASDRYQWWEAAVEARLHPFAVNPRQLTDYAGHYGIRTISVNDGQLIFQRDGRSPKTLIPLGPDLFGFPDSDEVRVRFRRAGGRVVGFDQVMIDGSVVPSDRDS